MKPKDVEQKTFVHRKQILFKEIDQFGQLAQQEPYISRKAMKNLCRKFFRFLRDWENKLVELQLIDGMNKLITWLHKVVTQKKPYVKVYGKKEVLYVRSEDFVPIYERYKELTTIASVG